MQFSRFEPKGRLKQQIRFQTTFLSTSHHGNQTKATHRHTHVGSTAGKTIIRSGGDTTLKGAQLIGKGVQADTRNLHIESVQDTETYQSKQQNGIKHMLGKGTWGEAAAGRKIGEMSILDGEMAGENKLRKQTNNVEYGGGNRLATHEYVNRNIQETRGGSQSSQFKAHAQRERENKTGLDFNHFIGGDINKKGTVTGGHSLTRGDVRVIRSLD